MTAHSSDSSTCKGLSKGSGVLRNFTAVVTYQFHSGAVVHYLGLYLAKLFQRLGIALIYLRHMHQQHALHSQKPTFLNAPVIQEGIR